MKMTIKNKLLLGFTGVLLLMAAIAGIGSYAVFSLRKSAQDTTRIGDRLNSISVEIQMHNLEAQRKVKSYFLERGGKYRINARPVRHKTPHRTREMSKSPLATGVLTMTRFRTILRRFQSAVTTQRRLHMGVH